MSHKNYILFEKKIYIFLVIKPSSQEIIFGESEFSIHIGYMYQRIHLLLGFSSYFAMPIPIDYQRMYMCCIVPLQRPKMQRILFRW